jgi:hypothetical protein
MAAAWSAPNKTQHDRASGSLPQFATTGYVGDRLGCEKSFVRRVHADCSNNAGFLDTSADFFRRQRVPSFRLTAQNDGIE